MNKFLSWPLHEQIFFFRRRRTHEHILLWLSFMNKNWDVISYVDEEFNVDSNMNKSNSYVPNHEGGINHDSSVHEQNNDRSHVQEQKIWCGSIHE